jgi:CubicO group peptidase (beta-lactamase class C family)
MPLNACTRPGRLLHPHNPSYSNIGFSLAGRVLEVATGQSYEATIGSLLFEPLGMPTATFFADQAIVHAAAAGHTVIDGQAVLQLPWAVPRTANAAGGIVVSARELLRYARLWLNEGQAPDGTRLLSPATLAAIGTEQANEPADLFPVGLTWGLARLGDISVWAHGGGTYGQNTQLLVVPGRDVGVCVLTNVSDGSAVIGAAQSWLFENLLGVTTTPPPPTPLAVSQAALGDYAGAYENPGEMRYTVSVGEGGLMVASEAVGPVIRELQPPPQSGPPVDMVFSAPDVLYAVAAPRLRAAFLRDPASRIAGLFYGGRYNPRSA